MEEQILIMQEYLKGTDKQLQQLNKNATIWVNTGTPDWNFKRKRYRLVEKTADDYIQFNNPIFKRFIKHIDEKDVKVINSAFGINEYGRVNLPMKVISLVKNLNLEDDEIVNFSIVINTKKERIYNEFK